MTLRVEVLLERWQLREPFEISREVMHELPLISVSLTDGSGHTGRSSGCRLRR
jgi:hypothetical protein